METENGQKNLDADFSLNYSSVVIIIIIIVVIIDIGDNITITISNGDNIDTTINSSISIFILTIMIYSLIKAL